ncbi:MAG: pantoate--beta-alanine ligase [Gammaproteobacteria bacterium]|nr:pantoate--beta-alanine ligase [Gammaproteobacteria bacterium]
MIEISQLSNLRGQLRRWRAAGETLALIPTMGNLHAGHLQLVRTARQQADRCVVSLFVNPMQFGEGEDYASYPRTYEDDKEKLREVGADLLYAPSVDEVYPKGDRGRTRVEVPGISEILCGASRPAHFVGVSTVVCKFFNMIQPNLAVFGEKDYQQLMVIRQMVEDLCIPVEVVGVPTVREPDGLALSSRNGYLTHEERSIANCLYKTLLKTAAAIERADSDYPRLEEEASTELKAVGFRPDYFSIRSALDLSTPDPDAPELVILSAAWLGKARLIDNLRVTRNTPV